jgi:hypothetical protein
MEEIHRFVMLARSGRFTGTDLCDKRRLRLAQGAADRI